MKVAQSCLTFCDPMDYAVHGIFQARILEWVAFPFSRGSSQPRDRTQLSRIAGGFFTRGATRGSPRILEWVAYLFSSGSSWPRNRARLSPTLQADSLPAKLPGKPYYYWILLKKLCQDNSFIQLTTTVT